MISGALHCAGKELRIRLRDRWSLVMWMLVPLTIGGMITSITGGGQPQPTAELLIVDEDDSFISGLIMGALDQVGDGQLIKATSVTRSEGQSLIDAGEASALLIVPKGFQDSVLKEEPSVLRLVTNPAQLILPGIVEEFLKVLVDGVFYLHRVFGDELKMIAQQVENLPEGQTELFQDAMIAELSISLNATAQEIAEQLDPPALALAEPENADDDSPDVSFALIFFPGIIFMGLLFAAQGLSDSYWKERDEGTLRRTMVSPLTLGEIFLGKLIAAAGLLLLLSAAMATLGFLYHGLDPLGWVPTVLWLTLSGLVLNGLMAFLQLVAPTRKSASLFTSILIFPLMMIGGAFFPFEALPDWLTAIGNWVPNGFLLERLKSFLIYDGGLAALVSGLPIALAMAVLLWLLCAWRMRAFARGSE